LTEAVSATRWTCVVLPAAAGTALILQWLNFPLILWRSEPPRPMTGEEVQSAVATVRAWKREQRMWNLLAQLEWKWIPNPDAALSETVRNECPAPQNPDLCYHGLHALFANGGQSPELAPVLVRLSEGDPVVQANWRSRGWLLERGETAHRYRSMLLDMLSLLGPAAAPVAELELVARLSDPEERSRWAAAGALDRVGSEAARHHSQAFFAQNLRPLIDSYRDDTSRRVRACTFLLRTELRDPVVTELALDALDDEDVNVKSCGAFLSDERHLATGRRGSPGSSVRDNPESLRAGFDCCRARNTGHSACTTDRDDAHRVGAGTHATHPAGLERPVFPALRGTPCSASKLHGDLRLLAAPDDS
jgi:hypothetical protein